MGVGVNDFGSDFSFWLDIDGMVIGEFGNEFFFSVGFGDVVNLKKRMIISGCLWRDYWMFYFFFGLLYFVYLIDGKI